MKICIIGTGYVGLVTGAGLAEFGMEVLCVDKDKKKISALKKGIIPFYEPGLEDLVAKNCSEGRLNFSTNIAKGIDWAKVIFIAVGTPPNTDGSPDLSQVEAAIKEIVRHMKEHRI
ncbi:MAG: UDP-glucose 6-dehydrogenase, partial [Candidatus Desulfofervidus auxilii]|nr:UDP-glucose 6-dehydrogenase [Candidatus Desulfofervidus auxilii]